MSKLEVPTETVPKEPVEPDIPKKWLKLDIPSLIAEGWTYRQKTKPNGRSYMTIRTKDKERSLGPYTEENEALLFQLFPQLQFPPSRKRSNKPFLSIPIRRVAVVPKDYKPSIDIIQYFHIFKANGFPGDFSDFINGNLMDHFVGCNRIFLPVMTEEQIQKVEMS